MAFGIAIEKVREMLDSPVFATVATIRPDGCPQQSVVWIGRDGDEPLFVTAAENVKGRHLRRDPRVSVLLNPSGRPYTYAAIRGTATLERDTGRELIDALSVKYTGLPFAEHNPEAAARATDLITVRVTPEEILGRTF
ncbi:PPOX class F420-dependent oxidoreductase [Spirillospora sp. CA-128828]|uniref:PPOX class F420-dependent oxidoreductase n=1 Tax=Spirillospora sp. CA-128828 TaxID=3240033 RepID=UPI003D8B8239